MKTFSKNDQSFICDFCGKKVEALVSSSRDHCNFCLVSKHVDINPGDRENSCQGFLIPIDIEQNSKKGQVIVYKCEKCGQIHKNKCAEDDNFNSILKVMNKTYNKNSFKDYFN